MSAINEVQSSEKRLVRGLVKFVPALACLFCLALLGTCLVESAYLISEPCIYFIPENNAFKIML